MLIGVIRHSFHYGKITLGYWIQLSGFACMYYIIDQFIKTAVVILLTMKSGSC